VQASERGQLNLVETRVVFPISEPTEIAGYSVFSPRHSTLVYLLVKPTYGRRRVATYLLSQMPVVASSDERDKRPYLQHCLSTSNFAKLAKRIDLRTRYTPMMFARLCNEITEDQEAA
jgi:hypothetical protein